MSFSLNFSGLSVEEAIRITHAATEAVGTFIMESMTVTEDN